MAFKDQPQARRLLHSRRQGLARAEELLHGLEQTASPILKRPGSSPNLTPGVQWHTPCGAVPDRPWLTPPTMRSFSRGGCRSEGTWSNRGAPGGSWSKATPSRISKVYGWPSCGCSLISLPPSLNCTRERVHQYTSRHAHENNHAPPTRSPLQTRRTQRSRPSSKAPKFSRVCASSKASMRW